MKRCNSIKKGVIRNAIFHLSKDRTLHYVFLVCVLLTVPLFCFGQILSGSGVKISGVIKDSHTGEGIPGVNVTIENQNGGTISDNNGKFALTVPSRDATLVFFCMGYNQERIKVGNETLLNVNLSTSEKSLDEIVVVGYGVQKKESVVGAVTQVENKALMESGTQNLTNAISGKLSGILTIQQSGQPGSNGSEILVRGLSSWNGSSPLVLVDGVERDFSDLDPTEVSSISVLKDASATAVYGARGANGVIIVTTKRGQLGRPELSASVSSGVELATTTPDHISSYTTMRMLNVALMNGQQFTDLIPESALNEYKNPSSALKALEYPDVDWYGELTKRFAPQVNANINLRGGSKYVKYFCSMGYLYEGSLFKQYHNGYDDTRYKYHRFNYRGNLDWSLSKTLDFSLNLGGVVGVNNEPTNSVWKSLYSTSPARYPAYFPAWVLDSVPDLNYPDASGIRYAASWGEWTGNPYTTMNTGSFTKYRSSQLFTDLQLSQKLDFITKGLLFRGKVSLSTYYNTLDQKCTYTFPTYLLDYSKIGTNENPWSRSGEGNEVYTQAPLNIDVGGLDDNFYKNWYYEMSLNYSRTIGNHTVTALALVNRQEKDNGISFPYYNEALVGRATYDYMHKYLLEFNMGYTGSERFSPSNRFGFFPAGAVGWVISEEPFFKSAMPWINRMKLRFSDGLTGSDKASSRWLYISNYSKTSDGTIVEDDGANSTAQWEEARKRDLGMEMTVFRDFSLNVDLFDEKRDKMLLTPRTVTFLVGTDFKDLNLGKMEKHGIEIEAEYKKQIGRESRYFVKGIFGINENRVVFEDDPVNTPEYLKLAGKPLGAQTNGVTLTGTGYYTSVDDIHNNISPISLEQLNVGDYKYCDYSSDGSITTSDKHSIAGSLYPPITYSLQSGFSYKGFDFSFMFQGVEGKYVDYNLIYECEFVKGNYDVHVSQLNYWSPDNQNATHATLHYSAGGNVPIYYWGGGDATGGYDIAVEDRFWRKADYLKLKEVYMAYNFNTPLMKKLIGVSGLTVYVTGNNLLTFTSLIEGDPERKDFDTGYYPQMTSVIGGLKFSF